MFVLREFPTVMGECFQAPVEGAIYAEAIEQTARGGRYQAMGRARNRSYNQTIIWDPVEQYLTRTGRTLFKALRFEDLRRMHPAPCTLHHAAPCSYRTSIGWAHSIGSYKLHGAAGCKTSISLERTREITPVLLRRYPAWFGFCDAQKLENVVFLWPIRTGFVPVFIPLISSNLKNIHLGLIAGPE